MTSAFLNGFGRDAELSFAGKLLSTPGDHANDVSGGVAPLRVLDEELGDSPDICQVLSRLVPRPLLDS